MYIPEIKRKKLANPEIAKLENYGTKIPEEFWDKFQKREIPSKPETRIKTDTLEEKIMGTKEKLLPHQFERAKKALSFLKYGAPSFQKTPLPSCCVKNTQDTSQFGEDVADTIATWLKKGYVSGPFKEPPLPKFRSNCLMAVDQGSKVRSILNVSKPKGESMNDNVEEKDVEKVKMDTARSFSYAILRAGKGARMYKTDVKDAYKNVPVDVKDLRLQGFEFGGRYFLENRLIFGASTSVSNYDITGKTILDLALANCEIPRDLVKRTIDDVPVVSPRNKDWGEKFTDEYKKVCKDINIELAEDCPKFEKAFTDSTYGKVLGKFFDTGKMAWMVPEEKRTELIREIESAHEYGVSTKQLESLLGKLNDIGIMCPFLKSFRSELYRDLSGREAESTHKSKLSTNARKELNVWWGFLRDKDPWNRICGPPAEPPIMATVFTSDAAGLPHACLYKGDIGVASVGYSGSGSIIFAQRQWYQKRFIMEKTDVDGKRFGNKTTTLEAMGLLLPLLSIPEQLRNKHIVLRVDNMGCVYGFNNHTQGEDSSAEMLLKTVHMIGAALGSKIYVEHAPRRSDWLSEMVDNMSRRSTTSEMEQLTLDRFRHIGKSEIFEKWMKEPKVSFEWPLDVTKSLYHKSVMS